MVVSFPQESFPPTEGQSNGVTDKPISACTYYLRPFFWNQKRKYGRVVKPALLWVCSPCSPMSGRVTLRALMPQCRPAAPAECAYPRAPRLRKIRPPWRDKPDRIASAFKAEVERLISFRSRLRNQERHDDRGY